GDGARQVIVDFSQTTFIDSTTLGVLVGGVKRLRPNGGELLLVCSDRNITKIFEITGLDRVFSIYPTRVEAVEQLDGSKPSAWVEPGNPRRCMPRKPVTGKDAEAVAAYVASVAGNPTAAPAGGGKIAATSGKDIFVAAGCSSCHTFGPAGSKGTVGPDLDQLPAEAKRAGKPLAAFTRESVVSPDAYLEPGFQKGVMPTDFAQKLSSAQIDALVKFL